MSKVGIRSGKLVRSFGRNSEFGLFEIKDVNGVITVVLGSNLPYADKLNRGGFIKAKKKKRGKTRDIYSMESMFWARYYASKNKFFKIMALSLIKKTVSGGRVGINISKTQYFDKSVDYLNKRILPDKYKQVIEDISRMSITQDFDTLNKKFKDRVLNLANKMPEYFQIALAQNMTNRGKGYDDNKVSWVN